MSSAIVRTGLQGGVDDRPIAGAAAEIAGERIVDRIAGHGPLGFVIQGEEAHDDAGRAEAALRAVMRHHGGLDRMQCALGREILDGDEFGAVDLAEQQDAGIDRLVDGRRPSRTRPSATVQAPQSPSAQPSLVPKCALVQSQIIEKGGARVKTRNLDEPSVPPKADRFSCHDHPPPEQPGSSW